MAIGVLTEMLGVGGVHLACNQISGQLYEYLPRRHNLAPQPSAQEAA